MASDKDDLIPDDFFADRLKDFSEGKFNESHWNSFEKLLDEEMPVKHDKRRLLWVPLAIIALGVAGFWLLPGKQKPGSRALTQKTTVLNHHSKSVDSSINPSRALRVRRHEEQQTTGTEGLKNQKTIPLYNKNKVSAKAKTPQAEVMAEQTHKKLQQKQKNKNNEKMESGAKEIKTTSKGSPEEEVADKNDSIPGNGEDKEAFTYDPVFVFDTEEDQLPVNAQENRPLTKPGNKFSLVSGVNYAKGFSNTDVQGKYQIGPVVGISYENTLSPKLSLNMMAFYVISGGHHLEQRNEIVTYFLDKKIEQNVVETRNIEYFQFPVTFSWLARPRHRFDAGIYVAALLNTRSEVRHTEIKARESTTRIESHVSGYYTGISPFDYGFSAGYAYRLFYKATLELRYQYGFANVTMKKLYGEGPENSTNEFQLLFKYAPFNE